MAARNPPEQTLEFVVRPEIQRLIMRIEKNMERRRQNLENQIFERRIVVDRVLSFELAEVPGMDKWLQRNRTIKEIYANQVVHDEYSHGTLRRIDLHRRYSTPEKKLNQDH